MKTHIVQSAFTSGEVAPTLHGRVDIDKYYQSLATALNVVIMPHGGVRRRGGLSKALDYSKALNDADAKIVRIEGFSFSTTQKYVLTFTIEATTGYVNIVRLPDHEPMAKVSLGTWSETELRDLDYVQSADTVLLTHENHPVSKLVRDSADETIWTYSNVTLTNIPTFDFGAGLEPVWSVTRGYPKTLTFHKGRLWFGGSTDMPNTVWASVVNDFFNFDTSTTAVDKAIFNTLDDDEFNAVNGIVSGRDLQVFTTGSEFIQRTEVPTPTDSNWKIQTRYGAKRIRPAIIDGATYYVDQTGSTVRQHLYAEEEDAYISQNIALMSSHLIRDVKEVATVKARATDISDLLIVVNTDGTVAVMNSMRHEGVLGWSQWNTQGNFIDVTVAGDEIYFAVERVGTNDTSYYFLEKITESTYTDHNTELFGTEPTLSNVIFGTDNVVQLADNVTYLDISTGGFVSELQVNTIDEMIGLDYRLVLENSVQEDVNLTSTGTDANKVVLPRDAYRIDVGLNYEVAVKTLPLNVNLQQGANINLRKRVIRVVLNVYESLGLYVQDSFMPDRKFVVSLDQSPDLFTGIKEIYLLGYGRLVDIEVTQSDPLPFSLLNLDIELEF